MTREPAAPPGTPDSAPADSPASSAAPESPLTSAVADTVLSIPTVDRVTSHTAEDGVAKRPPAESAPADSPTSSVAPESPAAESPAIAAAAESAAAASPSTSAVVDTVLGSPAVDRVTVHTAEDSAAARPPASGEAAAAPAAAPASPLCIFRWDLDKTYLQTDFDSFRALLRTAMQKAADKRTVPGAATLLRELRQSGSERGVGSRICFISGSPRQMRKVLLEKLRLDGVEFDEFILKPNLRNMLTGRFRAMREQVGYKLPALLAGRAGVAVETREVCFGDDAESDGFIYSLYGDVVAGRVERPLLHQEVHDIRMPFAHGELQRRRVVILAREQRRRRLGQAPADAQELLYYLWIVRAPGLGAAGGGGGGECLAAGGSGRSSTARAPPLRPVAGAAGGRAGGPDRRLPRRRWGHRAPGHPGRPARGDPGRRTRRPAAPRQSAAACETRRSAPAGAPARQRQIHRCGGCCRARGPPRRPARGTRPAPAAARTPL